MSIPAFIPAQKYQNTPLTSKTFFY